MPGSDLQLIVDAAQQASEIALKYWKSDPNVTYKDGGSPVSEADFAVDRYLRETLTAARPDYGWLSEETQDSLDRLHRPRVFVVDPIDGTRAFVGAEPTWAISIAVVEHGEPTAGAILLPARDKLYTARAGAGAAFNGTPLGPVKAPSTGELTILGSKSSLAARHWRKPLDGARRAWRPSLAYRFCLVAEGRFDATLTVGRTWEWDIAAGSLIAAEAGARVTDGSGNRIRFNTPDRNARGSLVAAPALHSELLARMERPLA